MSGRIGAGQKRNAEAGASAASGPPMRLDVAAGTLWRGTDALPVRAKTLAVLRHLIERAGAVVSPEELREAVWGRKHGSQHGPKQCIRELRALLDDSGASPRIIETVGRHGYRYVGDIVVEGVSAGSDATVHGMPFSVPACVGREAELAELQGALTRAQRGGRAVVLVAGEAGIGKSTLLDSFALPLLTRDDLWVARGHCMPHDGPREPYEPLLSVVQDLAGGRGGPAFVELVRNHAPSWLTQLPTIFGAREVAEKLVELTGTGPERMQRELTDVMERLTARLPGVIVLEDLQWADASTLGWIAAWALRRAPARLLILGTYRTGDTADQSPALAAMLRESHRYQPVRHLELAGLGDEAVLLYLEGRFPRNSFPPNLAQVLARRTDGHPIFIVAMVEEWLRRGELRNKGGHWSLRGTLADLAEGVPASVRSLIDRQIERLDDSERRLLEAASVAGQEFHVAAVVDAGGDVEHVEQEYDALARRGTFIRRTEGVDWPEETHAAAYAFRHALYQQAIYQQVPPARRAGLHLRIATRLEAAYGARVREIAALLAWHFECAGERLRAAAYCRQSGETALQRGATREAVEQLRRALGLISRCAESHERSRQELLAQTTLGTALMLIEGWRSPSVAAAYGRVRELCDALSDSASLPPALIGLWHHYLAIGDYRGTAQLAAEVEALARSDADPAVNVVAHSIAAQTSLFSGDLAQAEEHVHSGCAQYNRGRHRHLSVLTVEDPGVACHVCGVVVCALQGRLEAAEHYFREGQAIAHALNQPFGMCEMLWSGAIAAQVAGEAALVRGRAAALIEIFEKSEMVLSEPSAYALMAWASVMAGDDTALDRLRHVMGLSGGLAVVRPYRLALVAEACDRCGLQAQALEAIEEGLDLVRTTGSRWFEAELRRLKGEILLRDAGRSPQSSPRSSDSGIASLREALRIAQSQGARLLALRAATSLAQWHLLQGHKAELQALLAPAVAAFDGAPEFHHLRSARTLLASLG